MTQPILVFSYGNPSRGDDAIGPDIHEYLLAKPAPDTDTLTDFQLQIEHTEDLLGREAVIFVDASITAEPPFEFYPIQPEHEYSYTTHAMSPQTILSVFNQVNHQPPPAAYMLSVRAYQFELGESLSNSAQNNVLQAIEFLMEITHYPPAEWLNHIQLNDKLSAIKNR